MTRRNTRTPSEYYDDALNEVMLSVQPLLNQIQRSTTLGRGDYKNQMARNRSGSRALNNQLQDTGQYYNTATAGIAPQFIQDTGALSSLLGSSIGAPAEGERGAGINMMNTMGEGTLAQLAANEQRNASYNTSAIRQGHIQQNTNARNYTADFTRFLRDMRSRAVDVMESVPSQVQSVQRNLENDAFNRRMAQGQLNLSREGLDIQRDQIAAEQAAAAAQAASTRRLIRALLNPEGTTGSGLSPTEPWGFPSGSPGGSAPSYGGSTGTGGGGPVSATGLSGALSAGTQYPSLNDLALNFQNWFEDASNRWGQDFGTMPNAYEDKYKSLSQMLWNLLGGS